MKIPNYEQILYNFQMPSCSLNGLARVMIKSTDLNIEQYHHGGLTNEH